MRGANSQKPRVAIRKSSVKSLLKLLAGRRNVVAIKNGGNDADPLGAGFEDRIEVGKIDPANRKPWD